MANKATDKLHESHVTRGSFSSHFDEYCINCGATDSPGNGWGALAQPCTAAAKDPEKPFYIVLAIMIALIAVLVATLIMMLRA